MHGVPGGQSAMPGVPSAQKALADDALVVRSGSVSSCSLRDSLELTKSHLQPSGKPDQQLNNAEVCLEDKKLNF